MHVLLCCCVVLIELLLTSSSTFSGWVSLRDSIAHWALHADFEMLKILRLLFAARIELEKNRRLALVKAKTRAEVCEAWWPILGLSILISSFYLYWYSKYYLAMSFFGNFIFGIIARMFCGNLNKGQESKAWALCR